MLKHLLFFLLISLMIIPSAFAQKPKNQMYLPNGPITPKFMVDTRIDNMSYWRRMASLGLVTVQPEIRVPAAVYTTSKLAGKGVATEDSPDVPVTNSTKSQSENSIFVHPQLPSNLLNSNNSITEDGFNTLGADGFMSPDGGATWSGSEYGAGGENMGDPTTAISLSGKYYVGYVSEPGGQGISISTDNGVTWQPFVVANPPTSSGSMLDKNHLWIDNSLTSPYVGNLYDAWTPFGGPNDTDIEVCRSTDEGYTWSTAVNVSDAINAGSHNQGVNLQTGPAGEVYAIWAIYDTWNPSDENALGFARSLDGGVTWQPAVRVVQNMRGIRTTGVGKNHRVNSYPVMAVDISEGPYSGTIYAVWCNIGVPGVNTGNDVDIYMIKSTDQGVTWSAPIKVNQDQPGLGKKHYFPWITCDPVTGHLSVVYYDDRNVGATQLEVYTSNSSDGGATWWDMKVSDVAFTPVSVGGFATAYMGDYLGNTSRNGSTYPAWTDTRTGKMMTYVSPYQTSIPQYQPWIVYSGHTINDNAGNGNGLMDYNETLSLSVALENTGDEQANQVNVTLSSESEYITFLDNTEPYGDIPAGSTVTKENAFTFSVAGNIPDGLQVMFMITATASNDSTWTSNFMIEAHAPAFATGQLTLTEITGNGNGNLDAGETASISIPTINTGDYTAFDANAVLTTSSPYITIITEAIHYDSIAPGTANVVTPVFEISCSPETPVGHRADFNYQIATELHSAVKSFSYPVGLIIEDWESGTFNSYNWQFAGSTGWQISDIKYEGLYGACSDETGDNQTSEIFLTYNVMQDDSISFWLKTSCEQDYDNLRFYINTYLVGQWSGETGWKRVAFPVMPGNQAFRWVFNKDSFNSGGEDKAWIDYIVLPNPLQTTVYAGPDASVCQGDSYMLNGSAYNYMNTLWSTSGDGSFDNPASLTCFYTPGVNDLATGSATLTLTVTRPEGGSVTDTMLLSVSTQSTLNEMSDMANCKGSEVLLQGSAQSYTALNWNTSGSGYFTSPNDLITRYVPSAQDYGDGSVILTLTAVSESPCENATRSLTITFNPLPEVTVSEDTTLCSELNVTIAALAEGDVSYLWTPGNKITSSITVDSTGHGLGEAIFVVTVTDNANGCSTTKEVSVTFQDCSRIGENSPAELTVYPNPSRGSFDITIPSSATERYTIEIFDLNNKLVYRATDITNSKNGKISVKDLNLIEGIYNLIVKSSKAVYNSRLVIIPIRR